MRRKFIGIKKLESLAHSDPQHISRRYIKEYNLDRYKDCRLMGLYLCLAEIIHMSDQSDMGEWLNIYYITNCVVCFMFYLYTFKDKVNIKIIEIPTMLFLMRYTMNIIFF